MVLGCATGERAVEMEKALAHLLLQLETAGVLVSADNGTAHLTIDLCGVNG